MKQNLDAKIESIAHMICHAYNEDFDKISLYDQKQKLIWAESIIVYLQ